MGDDGDFCVEECAGNEKALKSYLRGIRATEIWPLKDHHRVSNKDIVRSPGFISWKCDITENACILCDEVERWSCY